MSAHVQVSLPLYPGQLNITGNERPLIIGLSHYIYCTWNGETNTTMMEWLIDGVRAVAERIPTEPHTIMLSLDPDNDALDDAIVTCRAYGG